MTVEFRQIISFLLTPDYIFYTVAIIFFYVFAIAYYFRSTNYRFRFFFLIYCTFLIFRYIGELFITLPIDSLTFIGYHYITLGLYVSPLIYLWYLEIFFLHQRGRFFFLLIALLTLVLFSIQAYFGNFFLGELQDNVIRLNETGKLFSYYFPIILVFILFRLKNILQTQNEYYESGNFYYLYYVIVSNTLWSFRESIPIVILLAHDVLLLLLLFFLSSGVRLYTPRELRHKSFLWVLVSSAPLLPILLITYYIYLYSKIINFGFAITIILIVYYSFFFYQRNFQVKIDRYFGNLANNLQIELDHIKSKLIRMMSIDDLMKTLSKKLISTLEPGFIDIYIWGNEYGAFCPYGKSPPTKEQMFRIYNPFLLWLSEQNTVFQIADFVIKAELSHISSEAREFFERTKCSLVFPLAINKSLMGIVCLGKRARNRLYNREELNFLHEVSQVGSIAISNSILYMRLENLNTTLEEKVKQRARALEEAQSHLVQNEKLVSLGVMVAGIAHEINTPSGVIKGAIENLIHNLDNFLLLSLNEKYQKLSNLTNNLLKNKIHHFEASARYRRKRKLKVLLQNLKHLSELEVKKRSEFLADFSDSDYVEDVIALDKLDFALLESLIRLKRNIFNSDYAITSIITIVKALKFYSHIDQSKTQELEVIESLENTLIILHNQIKHKIKLIKDYRSVPVIECIVGEINQIWTNILNNSIQALGKKGTLQVLVESMYLSKLPDNDILYNPEDIEKLKSKKGVYFAVVSVIDNGPGIQKENLTKIFDPFFTTKAPGEGTGLGLGIVKNIVHKHKGFIYLSSQPGRTVFSVFLPAKLMSSTARP